VGETAALALRLPIEGLHFGRFRERFGVEPRERWRHELRELCDAGVLHVTEERATIRERALLVNNEIAARFV
jgi:coproporphyrinogen III oxidase-like Fe-S oxidoreductase